MDSSSPLHQIDPALFFPSKQFKTVDPDYLCQICELVVQDPYECLNCYTLLCRSCCMPTNADPFCPNESSPPFFKKPHQKIVQDLEKQQFKCAFQKCPLVCDYGDYFKHLESCQYNSIKRNKKPLGNDSDDKVSHLESLVKTLVAESRKSQERQLGLEQQISQLTVQAS